MDTVHRRTTIISRHLHPSSFPNERPLLNASPCLNYSPPSDQILFSTQSLRQIMDGHDLDVRDWGFRLIESSSLFCPRRRGDRVFVAPDYNQTKEQQRVMAMRRVEFLMKSGVFEGWLTEEGEAVELRKRSSSE